ncbi:hypothetical protein BU24DRAFT_404121 [Aaosphaeria arxii CBS 175.79]|uniref:Acyltransferase MbtK/IucB-like conserved domain-containing protein n=1 Tax=Aaosphaeria arxii CBS 175.79 TaxID=1450172 RepID=A0A6A5Y8C5_9PLEO|nr:uncharacterized protein BU24DRAFT_404121 [Aaosphaeria arxii CBS 175.79]KAF2021070.1 hypothetical protein BU24DRAFT_404121 [Aaosphaeria arxii CBS 175.79]
MQPSNEPFILKLPHPYLTTYTATNVAAKDEPVRYQIQQAAIQNKDTGIPPPTPLHDDTIQFTKIALLAEDSTPPAGDNSSWARARRTPHSTISWTGERPSAAQVWLITYFIISLHPLVESFRIIFDGDDASALATELYGTGLFIPHPRSLDPSAASDGHLLLRGTFWQGAGSPFGPRPAWTPMLDANNKPITAQYPLFPFQTAPTTQSSVTSRHTSHPVRPAKPAAGSIIYSRWIPHLGEHLTFIAVNYRDPEHLNLFHTWQNDPRVAAGWNETGTLEEHQEYLRKLHEDPHVFAVFAAFEGKLFGYHELYWVLESPVGAHYQAGLYDRGRSSMVGDSSFRGPARASAWWSAIVHYFFLDDPRTDAIVGESRAAASSASSFAYDFAHGFHVVKFLDFPNKRSALKMVNREKFFTLSPLVWDGEKAVRPSLDALSKL